MAASENNLALALSKQQRYDEAATATATATASASAHTPCQLNVSENIRAADQVLVIGPKFFAYLSEWKRRSRKGDLTSSIQDDHKRAEALFQPALEAMREQLLLKVRMLDFTDTSAEEVEAFLQHWEAFKGKAFRQHVL